MERAGPNLPLIQGLRGCGAARRTEHSLQTQDLANAELVLSGLMRLRPLLTQHPFALAARVPLPCSPLRQTGH